jgi:hypothetical protein
MDKLRKKKIDVADEEVKPTRPPLHTVNWKPFPEPGIQYASGRWHVIVEDVNDKRTVFPAYCEYIDGEWYMQDGTEPAEHDLKITYIDHPPRMK